MALTELVNQPYKSIDGLTLTNDSTAPDTIINISAGQARDSGNNQDIIVESALNVDISVNGANGLDTGAAANNTLYYVYVIGDPSNYSPTAGILSTSASGPLMPAGVSPGNYSTYRLIGCMRTDGTADLLTGTWFGSHTERRFTYDTGLSILSAGTATTLTAVSLAQVAPAFANAQILLDVSFTPATPADHVDFVPFGTTGENIARMSGAVASVAQIGQLQVPCALNSGVPTVLYKNSAASGATTALIAGFTMSL